MLEESKIRQNETLLVENAGHGLGYQIIAAMHRLGVKCRVRGPADLLELRPLQVLGSADERSAFAGISAYLSAPLAALQSQTPLSDAEFKILCAPFDNLPASAHAVVVLPYETPQSQVESLFKLHASTTVVLSPILFGFRDEGFFEKLIATLRKQDGVTWEQLKHVAPFEGLSMSDLCGFLISVLWNKNLLQKTLVCPRVRFEPSEVIREFEKELEFKATAIEKIRAKLKGPLAERMVNPALSTTTQLTPEALVQLMPSASHLLDALPTTTTPVLHWSKKLTQYLERNPDSDLHFPPPRAP